MLSFIKEEPPYICLRRTSVLDDWHNACTFSLKSDSEEPPQKRRRRELRQGTAYGIRTSNWPFDWDWNGLFLHDFPLLQLPHTVLLDTLKLLDNNDRRHLSWSCQLMRDLIIHNKTPAMERRKITDNLDVRFFVSALVVFTPAPRFRAPREYYFNTLTSFLDGVKRIRKYCYCKKITVTFSSDYTITESELSEIVEPFGERTTDCTDVVMECPKASLSTMQRMSDAFIKHSQLKEISFGYRVRLSEWNECCSTVMVWAESQGMQVQEVDGCGGSWWKGYYMCLKIVVEGKDVIVISTPRAY